MSVVVPFPGSRAARPSKVVRVPLRAPSGRLSAVAEHSLRGGTILSWVRPATCSCCGRRTLQGHSAGADAVLCSHCTPPSIA